MYRLVLTQLCTGFDEEEGFRFESLRRPKYWTGRMLESWPVYTSDRRRAAVLKKLREAKAARSNFKGSVQLECSGPEESRCPFKPGFCWDIVPI
jgi:hypothetical protein